MTTTDGGSLAHERLKAVRESLLRITEPVRREVEQIDARLAEVEAERQDLLSARREAMAVLRVADPEEREKHAKGKGKPGPKAREGSERVREVADRIEQLLRESNGDLADGFTQTMLDRALPGTSPTTIKPAIGLLLDAGVLRFDKLVKGGGRQYALVRSESDATR